MKLQITYLHSQTPKCTIILPDWILALFWFGCWIITLGKGREGKDWLIDGLQNENVVFHGSVLLTYQQPFSIEVWWNEKRLSQTFGQLDCLGCCRGAYRNGDVLICESEFFTALLGKDRIRARIRVHRLCLVGVFAHVELELTWFAGSRRGASTPGSETDTGLRSMFNNFNWVWEDDGKVGKVFWKKQDIY